MSTPTRRLLLNAQSSIVVTPLGMTTLVICACWNGFFADDCYCLPIDTRRNLRIILCVQIIILTFYPVFCYGASVAIKLEVVSHSGIPIGLGLP